MPQSSESYHEPLDALTRETVERHRALLSAIEELEAVNWYDQRIDATTDDELRAILIHNRDEEKEHASMLLEWLRRHDPQFQSTLMRYVGVSGSIVSHEAETGEERVGGGTEPAAAPRPSDGSLGIGSLLDGVAHE